MKIYTTTYYLDFLFGSPDLGDLFYIDDVLSGNIGYNYTVRYSELLKDSKITCL